MDIKDMFKMFNVNIPETLEEAKEKLLSDENTAQMIELTSMINAIVQILIKNGITTEEEFNIWYAASKENIINNEAEKILDLYNDSDEKWWWMGSII